MTEEIQCILSLAEINENIIDEVRKICQINFDYSPTPYLSISIPNIVFENPEIFQRYKWFKKLFKVPMGTI